MNNGATGELPDKTMLTRTQGENSALEQNKLLEVALGQPGGRMDTRDAQAAERSNQEVETVGKVHRSKKP